MNAQSPIARAMLDMVLLNEDLESVLRIGEGAQSLTLELTNMTDRDMSFVGHGTGQTELHISFRPGTLEKPENVTASGDGWTGKMKKAEVFHTLVLTRQGKHPVTKDEPHRIKINNLIPAANGGSRATRVEVAYHDLQVDGEGPVDGRRIVHLSVLHPSVGSGQVAGAIAESGPLKAEIINSSEVIWKAGQTGTVDIHLSSSAPLPVAAQKTDGTPDTSVSKFTVTSPKLNAKVVGVHCFKGKALDPMPTRWAEAGNTVTYNSGEAHSVNKRFLGLELTVTSNAKPGIYPLYIDYENFGDEVMGQRRGKLTLLFSVVSVGTATDYTVAETSGALTVNGPLIVSKSVSANSLAVTKTGTFGTLTVAGLTKTGPLKVSGNIEATMITASSMGSFGDLKSNRGMSSKTLTVSGDAQMNNIKIGKDWNIYSSNNSSAAWLSFRQGVKDKFWMSYKKNRKVTVFGSYDNLLLEAPKVGIGIDKPEQKLHVKGNVQADAINLPKGWSISVMNGTGGKNYLAFKYGSKIMLTLRSDGATTNRSAKWSGGVWDN